MKSIKEKIVTSKLVLEARLKQNAESYYASKPLLKQYEELHGQTPFYKEFVSEYGEVWNKEVQENAE